MPRPDDVPLAPTLLLEADFGDDEFLVREHPDGLFTITMSETRLVVNAEQFQTILGGMLQIGKTKGWL